MSRIKRSSESRNLKDNRICVIDKVIKMLETKNIGDSFLINSWNGETTTYAHKKYGVKTHGYPKKYYGEKFRDKFYVGMYSVGIHMKDLTKDICRAFSDMGIEPWCWCPDTEKSVRYSIECGATSRQSTIRVPQ